MPKYTPCEDHLGNRFRSESEMARAYGLTPTTYAYRKSAGWPLDRMLTEPVEHAIRQKDASGNEYRSKQAMCDAHGISKATLNGRLAKGIPLKEALETPPSTDRSVPCRDRHGREYPSKRAMCKAYGLRENTLRERLRRGMPLREALETPPRGPVTGPDGRTYGGLMEMYAAYGKSTTSVRALVKSGMTLEQALLHRYSPGKAVADIFGRRYQSIKDMARAWRISRSAYRYHLSCSPETALQDTASLQWPGQAAGGYSIRRCLGFPWFLCEGVGNDIVILHARRILDMMHDER